MKIKILIPIYNDWQSVDKLINKIDNLVKEINHEFSIIIVNDASSIQQNINLNKKDSFKKIKILNMKENKGHTRCIATGLKYISEKIEDNLFDTIEQDLENNIQLNRL